MLRVKLWAMNSPHSSNPLLVNWDGPLALPPFASVRPAHFVPAFEQLMMEHLAELDDIATQPGEPTFDNTVLRLDRAGLRFGQVASLFGNLCAAQTSAELQAVQTEMAPRLAAHQSALLLNEPLFRRLDVLMERINELQLSGPQRRLLERFHLDFVRGGARLVGDERRRSAEISERLASLFTEFSQHVLSDESDWNLELAGDHDLAGLPGWLRDAAAQAATDHGLPPGSFAITLSRSLCVPFLTWSTRRDLRERVWRAWVHRGDNGTATDNKAIISEILRLRSEFAKLLGYDSFAEYQLVDTMAKTPTAVNDLLMKTWIPARSTAIAEHEELTALARADGQHEVAEWDWRFYAEQVRRTRYDLDDAELKPYFSLESVTAAAFDCARRLFGISFHERGDLSTYHPDVRVFEVHDRAGAMCGVFLADNFARPTKGSGAWMSSYRQRAEFLDGVAAVPVIANHNNLAKAAAGRPTLLSLDDARTLFHEFGHGLHGLLSMSPFLRLSGTDVLIDFVELPSQLFEHWILEPEILRQHCCHVDTGEPMPDELIARVQQAALFNQGFETVEYVSCALFDLRLHQLADVTDLDLDRFQSEQYADLGMPTAMTLRHRLPHFSHLFSSNGYASAYYVYLWAEVLDADAFDAFRESGDIFDPTLADRLRTYVYEAGDTIEPGAAYRAFRGRDATLEPMLKGRGLLVT